MGELSFLTIIVSLAVCSLLVYAIFQYMKVRLTNLEQSHKEQALILQQFIEESSTDIHRLYQMKSSASHNDTAAQYGGAHHGSIILEYANDNANATREYEEKPIAYNAPHMIHLDTAIFQNKRVSNLIEISSDSEDTTDSEGSGDESSDDESSGSEGSESEDSSDDGDDHTESAEPTFEPEHSIIDEVVVELVNSVSAPAPAPAPAHSPETKMITVDLGAIQESSFTSPEHQPLDVLAMLYKKSDTHEEPDVVAPVTESFSTSSVAHTQPFTGMSVIELRNLLKEKHPEKHAEIQKMKKAELIQALQ